MSMFSSEAPMARLLAAQARRRGFLKLHIWAGLSLLLCLVPAGAATLTGAGDSMEARTFVYVFAVALAALVPLGQIQGDAALLAGLRRGRCLEDILGTRTQAREIVDQVAGFSLLSVLKMGLAVAVPLLAGLLLVTPTANRALVLGLGLGWFPTAALLVLIGSYVVLAHGALVMGGYLVLNLLVSIAAVLGLRWLALSQVRTRLAPRR
jgi:hypothetical protein